MNIVSRAKAIMLAMGASPVMALMIVLSVISVAIILERAWFFTTVRGNVRSLARELADRLAEGDFAGARAAMSGARSVEAAIVAAGIDHAHRGPKAAGEAMTGAAALQRMQLERGLAFLGTLGNNAPFVGLFGTVVGIVQAFDRLGAQGANAAASTGVMSAIAEALVATAIGLLVAIPAVAAYNAFQRRIKSTLSNAEMLTRLLLARLEGDVFVGEPLVRSVRPSLAVVPAPRPSTSNVS
jgi:biopolymer transport protein ExbB